ncbi:hypothetical protein MYX64_03990 [Nitrospinae bacterium AH_259_B05_G02_I21]|nr:hypothetical protein [Nitrospinae bacterium AH_259_B05_G02_I21]
MTPLSDPSKVTQCRICSITVPVADLPGHLLADAKMLRVIKSTRPEWNRQECEEHLRALCVSHHRVLEN